MSFLLGIDQGTSGSRALILDDQGQVRGYAHHPLERLYPRPDWVEQDPLAVAQGVAAAITEAIGQAGCSPDEITACGISSQRNSDFAWSARTGKPLANAITWQDMRTLPLVNKLPQFPHADEALHRLGYPVAPYMTALHLAWRFQHDEQIRDAAANHDLRLGQSAAWLITALGQPSGHQMDSSLVQAMGLYDIRGRAYWQEWLDWLGIPPDPLPRPVPTIHEYGTITITAPDGRTAPVPVLAMIGDQQAALFGHDCRQPGDAETTHGTGTYVKVFLGPHAPFQEKMDTLCAWDIGGGQTYCLEAQTTVTGAVIRWMRESAGLFATYGEMDELAAATPDSGGVVFVPAFTGLNVPYNDRRARGTLFGLSLGSTRGHIARAFMEAVGYQLRAILETIQQETGVQVQQVHVGGGVSASDIACQIQADMLGLPVIRPTFTEMSARAAALLAGLGAGVWSFQADLPPLPGSHTQFSPCLTTTQRDDAFARWQKAVTLSRKWGQET